MSAWSKDFSKAPKDKPFLVRGEHWHCPAVMQWYDLECEGKTIHGLMFTEELLSDVDPGFEEKDISSENLEWTLIPN